MFFDDANGGNSSFYDKDNYALVNGRNKIFGQYRSPYQKVIMFLQDGNLKGDSTGKIYSAKNWLH